MNTTSTISRARSHVLRLLAVATIGTHGAAAIADVIHVPADQPTIQAGIDAAVDGDQVVIAPGTYAELINFNGKAIVVRSTDPMDPDVVAATILDGEGTGPVVTCDSGEGPNTVLRGLTVTNGVAAENGGGMYISACSPKVTDCVFHGNAAENAGGGMYYDQFPDGGEQVLRCEFTGNAAYDGAGMWVEGEDLPITGCTFANNSAVRFGGGLWTSHMSEWIRDCTFTDNVAAAGGGMYATYHSGPVRGCTFIGNSATQGGGGLYMRTNRARFLTMDDCSFWGNSAGPNVSGEEYGGGGGGMFIHGNWDNEQHFISDCTFVGNAVPGGDGQDGSAVDSNGYSCGDWGLNVVGCCFSQNQWPRAAGCIASWEGNESPDYCCPGDADIDGEVDFGDILAILAAWGNKGGPEDLDGSGTVDFGDLLIVLGSWGPCA